jgi:hypothetical protein
MFTDEQELRQGVINAVELRNRKKVMHTEKFSLNLWYLLDYSSIEIYILLLFWQLYLLDIRQGQIYAVKSS